MQHLIKNSLKNGISYTMYREMVSKLLSEGKSTGNEQSDDLLHYSQLNEVRMNRLDKTIVVPDTIKQQLEKINKPYIWLVLAEGWCGDAAQIIPIINKMANLNSNINFQLVFRDENDDLMQCFLTNGARAIPKLLIINAKTFDVEATWGPRPEAARRLIADYKATYGLVDETAKTELQKWYFNDKGIATMQEILAVMPQNP